LPPTAEPLAPTDFTLAQFDKAVAALIELRTKSVRKFLDSAHSYGDLHQIIEFLLAVAKGVGRKQIHQPELPKAKPQKQILLGSGEVISEPRRQGDEAAA
jgi:hypothetical protein